jgi:1,4-dihydroxy-2-naphthoyl-CoA synthase
MISIMASAGIKGHNSSRETGEDCVDGSVYSALICREIGNCRFVDLHFDDEASLYTAFAELGEVCNRFAWDEQARIVVLSFDGEMAEWNSSGTSIVEPVAKLKQPVIAAIRGDAIGIGLELALACDLRIATEGARLGFPQIQKGRIPSNGGTQRLPRLIGHSKAMEMILTGDLINAEEARRWGLIHRVVPADALMSYATELANDMSEKSPLSLSYAKEALYSGGDLTLDQGLKMELDLYLLLFSTSDRAEGITAFKEKRKPKFDGA